MPYPRTDNAMSQARLKPVALTINLVCLLHEIELISDTCINIRITCKCVCTVQTYTHEAPCFPKLRENHCFIMRTPITLIPLIVWCLGCPWGTQPATTKCLSSSCALLIAFLKLSSEGFFTVQLLRSHRSAASESSTK